MTIARRSAARCALPLLLLSVLLAGSVAEATPIRVSITVDNSYAIFYGTAAIAAALGLGLLGWVLWGEFVGLEGHP